jgi:hypothetical protein
MKKLFTPLRLAALTGLALAASVGTGQAAGIPPFVQGSTYTQNFDIGTNTANFSGSGSVASWIYWFNTPGGNLAMTNDVGLDAFGNTNSGSLIYGTPWNSIPVTTNTQNVIFGTFGNQFGYDTGTTGDMTPYDNINFWIRVDPTAPARLVGGVPTDYGDLAVGFFYPYSFEAAGTVVIPLSASNAWVHLSVPVPISLSKLTGINGIAFNLSSFDNNDKYLLATNSIFYLDAIQVHAGRILAPPALGNLYKPVTGFNAIASTATKVGSGEQFNREQIVTAADTGYTFNGANATYTMNIKSFPSFTNNAWQAHFFIVNGAPGQFDQAADYNLPDVMWFTVGPANATNPAAGASFNFRLKTNEAGGNGMLFNGTSPTDTVNNPNGWPVEPIAALTDPNGATGSWSFNIQNNTNITVTSPSGLTTNFSITAAQAALFADPVSLILGGQPNNTNGEGLSVVYNSFSATGVAAAFTDNFLTDTSFNTNLWKTTIANDTNGVVLVPANALYWLPWTLPDGGYILQTKGQLGTAGGWSQPNPLVVRYGGLTIGTNQPGVDQALIVSGPDIGPAKGFFQLIRFQASMLQVLFDGQTNAPGPAPGYTGSPTPIAGASGAGAAANVTVNAVDSNYNIDHSIGDTVTLTSSADPNAVEPLPFNLVGGTSTQTVLFTAAGNWTVTATDNSTTNIAAGTSAVLEVDP